VFLKYPSQWQSPGRRANFTTMHPHMQKTYSAQGIFEIEQLLRERSTLSSAISICADCA